MRQGGDKRLCSLNRLNEPPKENCDVCADDSSFIASIHIKDFASVTLEMLVKTILPDGLKVDSETLLIEFEKKMIYEYDPDMSDDEMALF